MREGEIILRKGNTKNSDVIIRLKTFEDEEDHSHTCLNEDQSTSICYQPTDQKS